MKKFIWQTYIEELEKKYSLFIINREYKNRSFKNENEYLSIQTKLANEIDNLNNDVKKSINDIINETYPNIEVIAFDSRSFSYSNNVIGTILVKGLKLKSETLDVKSCFENLTNVKINVDRFEDLSEEDQKSILKMMGEKHGI